MNCPICGQPLAPGSGACPACSRPTSTPAVEGALATEPAADMGAREERMREIPGLRKRERTWRDEVQERVRRRRRERSGVASLPLFPEPALGSEPRPGATVTTRAAVAEAEASLDEDVERALASLGPEPDRGPIELPLALPEAPRSGRSPAPVPATASEAVTAEPEAEPEPWILDDDPTPTDPADLRPPERPARLGERARAAALDAALLGALALLIVFGASRAARVSLPELVSAWPHLLGYLLLMGLAYAAYFTGMTGQTLGKIAVGIRVVDHAGRPPGAVRALVRAAVGVAGGAALLAGFLPILVDPARRAFHDRLLRTRVIHR